MQTFGLGQGSTAATDIWCIIHVILMHTVSTHFISIILVYVSGIIQHKRIGEGLIDDTGCLCPILQLDYVFHKQTIHTW
jgi:hypothetical protein